MRLVAYSRQLKLLKTIFFPFPAFLGEAQKGKEMVRNRSIIFIPFFRSEQ